MIFSTTGIVLRNIKYGDTSGVVTILTRQFGLQSYLINGIRTSGKSSKAHLYQPASLVDMEVYHNELKKLQRVRDARWSYVYKDVFTSVSKHSAALFMVELLQKTLQHPEENERLFDFCERCFLLLDSSMHAVSLYMPVFFALHLPAYLGFGIDNNFSEKFLYFNAREGIFTDDASDADVEQDASINEVLSFILKIQDTSLLASLKLERHRRQRALRLIERFYKWHIAELTGFKTLEVFEQMF